jgi:general secretion pathway protein D
MRRRPSNIAAVLLTLASLVGCATPKTLAPPAVAAPVPIPPPPPSTPTQPVAPPLPPMSVGPRTVAPPARAEVPPTAPTPSPPTVPRTNAAARGRFIVLNFDNADIETVVHAASEIVGFNYVLAPDVRGKVTVQTSGRIPQEDVFGVLLAILEVHGFTAVKSGNLYKIIKIEGARERAVPLIAGDTADPSRAEDEVITQIVPIRYASVTDLNSLLRPLMSARGSLIAHRETNVLIVTDTASNIRRLLDIVRLVDVEVALDELAIERIRYADAADLATILNQLFTSGRLRRAAGAVGGPGALPAPPAPTPAAPAGAPTAGASGQTTAADRGPLIIAERRSNSLIIYSRRQELETIRRLVTQLDVNIYGGRRVFIYYAENAKAKDLAATLNAIYGAPTTAGTTSTTPGTLGAGARPSGASPYGTSPFGGTAGTATPSSAAPTGVAGTISEVGVIEGQVRFIADETTNAVIVSTFPRAWSEIEATIKQLDRMPRQVLIEVLVAEITLTDDTRLGIDWAVRAGKFSLANQSFPSDKPAITPLSQILPIAQSLTLPLGSGLTAFTFASGQFMAMLNTLAGEGRVNIVSSPHVMTSENKKAIINVSQSVPVITGQQTSSVSQPGTQPGGATSTQIVTGGVNQTVEYRDAGVILTVTPRIGERGTVALDVKQEVNAVGPAVAPTGSLSFFKREAETSVVLLNNQTLVLGGLIQDKVTINDRGVPFLKNIPIIGFLFGFKERAVEKTELLLLITPRVIGTALDAARITEQMRKSTPELDDAIRSAPRPPSATPSVPPVPPPPPPASPVPPSETPAPTP